MHEPKSPPTKTSREESGRQKNPAELSFMLLACKFKRWNDISTTSLQKKSNIPIWSFPNPGAYHPLQPMEELA
jgi:hypothetical protein